MQYCVYHRCDGEAAKLLSSDGDVATNQSGNNIEDNHNDEQQYWEPASSSFSKINNGSHVQTGAKIDSYPSRHSTTQKENASNANFYLSGIASVILVLSLLRDYGLETPARSIDHIFLCIESCRPKIIMI